MQANIFSAQNPKMPNLQKKIRRNNMKKFSLAFLALATLTLLATGCGGGGGGGSDDDDATPVAENGSTGTGSGSSESGSGSENTGGDGSGGGSISVTEGLVPVSGATFDGTTAITLSGVFIAGRTVTIPSLWACDHEVTQAEYQSVMGSNPSSFSSSPASGETQANRPVESVSWYDALVYCNKKSAQAGRTPCYKVNGNADTSQWGYTPHGGNSISGTITCDFTANGYRLPTEAEWEYFARGGNLTNSGQKDYSGDDNIESVAWYVSNSGSKTHEVKKKAKNALNLYDMSGNVWEWCWDWYGSISTSTPSSGAASGSYRVARGGGWIYFASYCAVSNRYDRAPDYRNNNYGFRVVCSRSE